MSHQVIFAELFQPASVEVPPAMPASWPNRKQLVLIFQSAVARVSSQEVDR